MFGVFVRVCASSAGGVIRQRGGDGKRLQKWLFFLFFIWTENIDLLRLYLDSVQELGTTDRTKANSISFY